MDLSGHENLRYNPLSSSANSSSDGSCEEYNFINDESTVILSSRPQTILPDLPLSDKPDFGGGDWLSI